MSRHAVVLALGLMLLAGLARGASPALAAPEDFVEACSNGIAVPDPDDNPGLVQDCAILLSIRDTLAGDATFNWAASQPLVEWRGVEVSLPRGVTGLRLHREGLTGHIPEDLGKLSSLTSLDLSYNNLSGDIPDNIGNLTELQYLDLAGNYLTGEMPPSLWQLWNLQVLRVARNRLIGSIPEEIGNLRSLVDLNLYHNGFLAKCHVLFVTCLTFST